MTCGTCGAETVPLSVAPALREYAPDDAATIAVCTRCLRVSPVEGGDSSDPRAVSDALPADPDAAVALLLAASLLDSLASNRPAVEALVERVERAGVDPALAFERLAGDPDLEPAVDLARRYRQFEGMRG